MKFRYAVWVEGEIVEDDLTESEADKLADSIIDRGQNATVKASRVE